MRGCGAASDEKGFGRLLEKAPGAWLAGVSSKVQMKPSLRLHSHSCYDPCSYSSTHPISTCKPGRASCLILAVPEERLRWSALLLSVACPDRKGPLPTPTSPLLLQSILAQTRFSTFHSLQSRYLLLLLRDTRVRNSFACCWCSAVVP